MSSKVLVVGENPQQRELLKCYLAGDGHEVEMVCDGEQALDAVARSRPDVILLDILTPKIGGYEVCRRLKSNPETRDISVVLIGQGQIENIEKAVDSGANDFLVKPVSKLELLARVKTLVELRRLKG